MTVTLQACERCHVAFAGEKCLKCHCVDGHCIRPPYADGRCKRHTDEHRYAKMRELELACMKGVRVCCLVDGERLSGTAHSKVRLVPRPLIPTRGRWPSVLVRIDGHNELAEWPAINVELGHAS